MAHQLQKGGVSLGREQRVQGQTGEATWLIEGTDGEGRCWHVGSIEVGYVVMTITAMMTIPISVAQQNQSLFLTRTMFSTGVLGLVSRRVAFPQMMTRDTGLIYFVASRDTWSTDWKKRESMVFIPSVLKWHIWFPRTFHWPKPGTWSHLDALSNVFPGQESFPRMTTFWGKALIFWVGQEPSLPQ